MNRSDWLEYFEAINGRPATGEELAAAMENGEIVDVTSSQPQAATVAPEAPQTNQVPPVQPEVAQQGQVPSAPQAAPLVSPERQEQMKQTSRDFWNWLVSAWKNPLSNEPSKVVNSWLAFSSLSLLSTLTYFILLSRVAALKTTFSQAFSTNAPYSNPIGFQAFLSLLFVITLVLFSLIFAGFITRRFVYQESSYTFTRAMEWYSRLFSISIPIMAIAVLFSFIAPLDEKTMEIWGYIVGVAIFTLLAGTIYILSNFDSVNVKINKYYIYLLGLVVNAAILYIFGAIARTFVESYILNLIQSVIL